MINRCKSNRGQTIIEFAFIMVLLFIFILGIMEWSIILYDKAILTDACREGAREGALYRANPSTFADDYYQENDIRNVVRDYVQGRLVTFGTPFNAANVHASWNPSARHGAELTVRVDFTYTFLALPNLVALGRGRLGSGTLNLSARSIMRME